MNSSEMFREYPDVVNVTQLRSMLGGIGRNLAYTLLTTKSIKNRKLGRDYIILKKDVIEFLLSEGQSNECNINDKKQ